MDNQRVPFPTKATNNPNQFFSAFERNQNNRNNPYNLDESGEQIFNRTFTRSIESSHWDNDNSNLLADLEELDQIKQKQADQRNSNKNDFSKLDKQYLNEMLQQQQKKIGNILEVSSPQKSSPQIPQKQENTFFPDQDLKFKKQTSQKRSALQGSFNMFHGKDDNRLGETLISEYVSEDFHSQHNSPLKELVITQTQVGGNNQNNPSYLHTNQNQNQLSVLISQQEDNAQSTSHVHNEQSVLSILKEHELEKPVYINVMVAGAQGLGKSTFIDAFLNKKFHKEQPDVIRPKTEEIVEVTGIRTENKIKLHLNMIDTPGYSEETNIDEWIDKIIKHIVGKFENYKLFEDKLIEDIKSVQQEDDKDCRVHVCLYFIQGRSISKFDQKAILKLQEHVSIIPILAKGDTYMIEEVKQIKQNIIKDAHDNKISFFDCEAPLKNDKERLQKLRNGPFGHSPPFLMISSVQKIEIEKQKIYARKYPWGICKIEDPEHSDFLLLYQLLIGYFIADLKKLTDIIYKQYLKKKKKQIKEEKKNKQNQKLIGGGVALAIAGLLGFIKYQAIK
ncbi:septin protein (macronuclear) [Tetrahymena thermophila SB210]|uniref:Septin protein n=1 Tax=Tetrahymena thermophila (strain SB210) TaxID=312017 RepID=I7M2Q5_TETTS|nr:septin protein [Tetrahymena thermophila SB210]EAS01103.2 septin protein [Tetrahymena thermophila SB210]|eukprot:XP_001021348.2 septin protein [Tetrahymena thermophila SB210]